MARKALLIHNPAAGRRRSTGPLVARLESELSAAGLAISSVGTRRPGHAAELARDAARQGLEFVFCFGGDGTLRECARGLLGTTTALGFLPGGTVNVMAHVLGLPQQPLAAAALLGRGSVVEIDVGRCGREPFLMQASAGLDAAVLSRLSARRKAILGRLEVALQLAVAFASYRFPVFTVRFDGEERQSTFAAVCNIPLYGGRWRLAPGALWSDRRLDLVLFSGRGPAATLGFVRDLLRGRHQCRADVEIVPVAEVAISAAPGLDLQLDGDALPAGSLPAEIRLAPNPLRMLAPAGSPFLR